VDKRRLFIIVLLHMANTMGKHTCKKIDRVKKRFVEEGLEVALEGHKGICKKGGRGL